MRQLIFVMLLLAFSTVANAQTFGFNKLDTSGIYDNIKYSLSINSHGSYISFQTKGDSVTSVVIKGDTMAVLKQIYYFFNSQYRELNLATEVLNTIDFDRIYAQSNNLEFYKAAKAYRNYLKNQKEKINENFPRKFN